MTCAARIAVSATALLVLTTPPVEAARPWGAARTPDRAPAGTILHGPAAAIDDRGYVVAAWVRQRGVQDGRLVGARRTPRRGFGRLFTLRRDDAHTLGAPQVGRRERRVFVSWLRHIGGNRRVESRTVRANGRRSITQTLSGGGPTALNLAVVHGPRDGHALAWTRGTGTTGRRLQVTAAAERSYPPARTAGTPGDPSSAGVAVDRDGRLVVAAPDPANGRIVLLRAASDGAFAADQALTGVRVAPGARLAVAADDRGRVTVAWVAPAEAGQAQVVAAVQPAPGQPFGPPRVLATERGARALDAAGTTDGRVRVAWLAGAQRFGGTLRIADPSGGPARTVSRAGDRVEQFVLRAGARGEVTLVWVTDLAREPGGPVHTAAVTASGRPGVVQRLSDAREQATSVSLAVGPRNDAIAMWSVDRGRRIRAARRPASG